MMNTIRVGGEREDEHNKKKKGIFFHYLKISFRKFFIMVKN